MALLKMEQKLQTMGQENEALQHENARLSLFVEQHPQLKDSEQQQQVVHLNMVLNDFMSRNKELMAIQEQNKAEIDAQNATLEEQRKHIDMLEKVSINLFHFHLVEIFLSIRYYFIA